MTDEQVKKLWKLAEMLDELKKLKADMARLSNDLVGVLEMGTYELGPYVISTTMSHDKRVHVGLITRPVKLG